MRRKERYRLGIVGLGRMGSTIDDEVIGYPAITLPYSIAAAARASSRLELAVGCDTLYDKRMAFSERWGVSQTYVMYERMLAQAELDMVAICTRGRSHAEITLAATAAGVPMIFCEKAMACSLREADAVRNAVQQRGTCFNTGVLRRFDSRYHRAREVIASGALGELRAAVHYAPASLLHGHIHSIDTLLYLLGDVPIEAVRGEFQPRDLTFTDGRLEPDPRATYQLRFAGGIEAWSVPAGNWEFEILGTEGSLRSGNNGSDWLLRRKKPVGTRFSQWEREEFSPGEGRSATVACLEDLVRAYESGSLTLGHVQITHHATEACFAVADSHCRGGVWVDLPLTERDRYIYHV